MTRYKELKTILVDVTVSREDLVGIAEAARFLGITTQGLAAAVDRGQVATVIIDTEAPNPTRGRRLLLWTEVHERKRRADERHRWKGD